MHSKHLRGQILVITLLSLLIISIFIVGIAALVNRDVAQTVANRDFQELYNLSETSIFKIVDKYGNTTVPLNTLTQDFAANPEICQPGVTPDTYSCDFTTGERQTQLQVEDTAQVEDYELGKDESLYLNLEGYTGQINFSYSGNAALEFAFIYDVAGNWRIIQDLFDTQNVFSSNGGDPLSGASHAFNFSDAENGEYSFRVSNIQGFTTGAPRQLRITARMSQSGAIGLNVRGESGFPKQIRKLVATSFQPNAQSNVVAAAITQIPLLSQPLSLFNYTILTNQNFRKVNLCGNGVVDSGELCDAGINNGTPACTRACL